MKHKLNNFLLLGKKLWSVQLGSADTKLRSPTKGSVTFNPDESRDRSAINFVTDPPTKRHCRSLTCPAGGQSSQTAQEKAKWQPQESDVWKPIDVATTAEYHSKSYYGNKTKVDCVGGQRSCSMYPNMENSVYNVPTSSHLAYDSSRAAESQSQACSDCGIPTFGRNKNYIDSGFIFTPPESPVPRPSSTSTCTGRQDYVFSPLGAPWLEQDQSHHRFDAFQNRSLSFEDKISCTSSSGSTTSVPGCLGNHSTSHPYHHHNHHHHHHHHHIPRCRSQPSMTTRKYGMKRRRDSDQRPSLNFHKMTEVCNDLFWIWFSKIAPKNQSLYHPAPSFPILINPFNTEWTSIYCIGST